MKERKLNKKIIYLSFWRSWLMNEVIEELLPSLKLISLILYCGMKCYVFFSPSSPIIHLINSSFSSSTIKKNYSTNAINNTKPNISQFIQRHELWCLLVCWLAYWRSNSFSNSTKRKLFFFVVDWWREFAERGKSISLICVCLGLAAANNIPFQRNGGPRSLISCRTNSNQKLSVFSLRCLLSSINFTPQRKPAFSFHEIDLSSIPLQPKHFIEIEKKLLIVSWLNKRILEQ